MAASNPPEPILRWKDVRGYALSDRIWNISEMTAKQIDALLAEGINTGMGSLPLSRRLERFLLPGRELPRTTRPYGTDASFNAMRLARSEITRAHSIAVDTAARLNRFVTRMYYKLSAVHKPDSGDPCEKHAAESLANDGFPVGQCPLPMVDTHPHCICYVTQGTVSASEARYMVGEDPSLADELTVFRDDTQSVLLKLAIMGIAYDVWQRLFGDNRAITRDTLPNARGIGGIQEDV
jgi:hypothetical protein